MQYFHNKLNKLNCTRKAWFSDKFASKNNNQNEMQITFLLMASKIDLTTCVMSSCTSNFLICLNNCDV